MLMTMDADIDNRRLFPGTQGELILHLEYISPWRPLPCPLPDFFSTTFPSHLP